MSGDWRRMATIFGAVLAASGLAVWLATGNLGLLIAGAIILVTALLEPSYGKLLHRAPRGDWRATDERFVDPETGKRVTVWIEPATGARRYVSDSDASVDQPPFA